ncbi:hypothetical protein DTL21_23330 [Bremerella cremea]|uniref:ParD-like antitoxin of type II toxin-antitoxin system n=1 Tax=Blastopirellula marina TaxID=124 RepID=A0A2S8FDQ8_9BACT|nr:MULTISPECIES: hypothetical protein [Pirellulaceae]PQO30295.1 hypothetical protein C5Y83_23295 [Blastopirellula marina]RCS43646.1 hypothetical protein DTL21_23330 [Bremerella cremea]
MSQPVKLSDTLVNDARATSSLAERSIAGQIEFWAQLGKAIEPLLYGDQVFALRKRGDLISLTEVLETVDTSAGKARLETHLQQLPFPHYEPTDDPDYLVRIEQDGSRTTGRFVEGKFVTGNPARKPKGKGHS